VAARHDQKPRVRQQLHRALADPPELPVPLPRDDRDRQVHLCEAAPQGIHLPGAQPAQNRRERVGAVAQLVCTSEHAGVLRLIGEQRLGAPALDEVLERLVFQPVGEQAVGLPAARSLGLVLDARIGADQDQARHALGRGERDVQGDAPAHRIAREHEPFGAAFEHARDARIERDRPGSVGERAVSGQVERKGAVAFSRQMSDDSIPGAMRAAETVQQDDGLGHGADPTSLATYTLLSAFVDELARCGLRDACTSPGSRCTPLVLALAHEQRLRCHSHIDERCAGFFALGAAKASGLPVAITCTSGTALANLLPAVVEAHEARVPLIVLSADRPPELREVGAGQTIDQLGIFGRFAKWFFEVGCHQASPERVRWIRMLACRAYWQTLEGRPGVVHLNFPLREPLVLDGPLPKAEGARPDGYPLVTRPPGRLIAPRETDSLAQALAGFRRGVLIAGRHERDDGLREAAAAFCERAGWPLLADPLSGARRGRAAIAHYDALLRDPSFAAGVRPEVVLRVGDLPTSKPLRAWLASMQDVPQALLDAEGAVQDPDATLCRVFAVDPATALEGLDPPTADSGWLSSWSGADERAAQAISSLLGTAPLSEPAVALELGVLLPETATLFVASSMPVRDIETFWPAREEPPRVLCNRGANGIDGTVSAAFGAAAAAHGDRDGGHGPVVLLIGDVALAHDVGGLLAAGRLGLKLTIVLLNNEGGGIFDFLPVAGAPAAREPSGVVDDDIYTRHIATPTGLDFEQAASLYGFGHERVETAADLRLALERALAGSDSSIVEVRTDRQANVDLHRRVWSAVEISLKS
jgi:2-succinyl-5-enolpyruvyl-6-hydroxy-3-cyclohexene-1-carboxylate synthase